MRDSDVIDGLNSEDVGELVAELVSDYSIEGRHHRTRGNAKKVDIHALAKRYGYRLVPAGKAGGATVGDKIDPSNQRRQLIAFTEYEALGAGASFQLEGKVQKAIQVELLTIWAVIAASGNDASTWAYITDVKVGTRSQLATLGRLPLAVFTTTGWGRQMILDAARTGNDFAILGSLRAVTPGPINLGMGGIGLSAE